VWESHHGWVYRVQPEHGAVRVVHEPIAACVCVVNVQEQIRGLWKGDILLRRESPNRVDAII